MRDAPLRVAILCSHRAPGLRHLLASDPNRGRLYEIVCCITSEESSSARAEAENGSLPFIVHSIDDFCRVRGAKRTDLGLRAEYDRETVEVVSEFEADLILLASYLLILTGPMLRAFPNRIVNIHHSDLTLVDGEGRPRYIGLHSVWDAILAGESETRATAHIVTDRLDEGPLLVRSPPFPVSPLVRDALRWNAPDILKAYAFAHQEWMLRSAWGPLFSRSLALVACGRWSRKELSSEKAS